MLQWYVQQNGRLWTLEADNLGLNPESASVRLCDLREITPSLCFLIGKKGDIHNISPQGCTEHYIR